MQNPRVRNLFSTILGVGAITGSLVLSSCEDEFTEEDAIKAQQEALMALNEQEDALARAGAKVSYSVTVVAGGSANTNARTTGEAFAEGATVTVMQGGVSTPATTGKGGVATFADLRAGEAVVTVEAEGFTTVTYTTSLGDNDSYNTKEDNVETTIPIFPTTLAGGASEVSGTAWAETNALNDTPEFAEGAVVRATISVQAALNSYGIYFSNSKGEIKSATYSDFVQTDTVDAEGHYSLVIPNGNADSGNGIPHTVEFLPFVGKQTYAKAQGDSLAVVTEDIVFGDGNDGHIESLASVYAVIDAPVNNAQGFELTAEALRTELETYGSIDIDARGAGYEVGDRFNFAADADDQASYIEVLDVDDKGVITVWDFVANGASYSEKPALSQDADAAGSGASFILNFETDYAVKIANGGSGYFAIPEVSTSYQSFDDNGNLVTYNRERVLSAGVVSGKIQANGVDGIVFSQRSATAPSMTIINPIAQQAIVRSVIVEEDGTISDVSMEKDGTGYSTQPKVTFKTIGENMGSGATAIAEIDTEGRITGVSIVNPGSGYMSAVNTFSAASYGMSMSSVEDREESNTMKPGAVKVNHNYYYGGGSEK